jgi:hypothetical protein
MPPKGRKKSPQLKADKLGNQQKPSYKKCKMPEVYQLLSQGEMASVELGNEIMLFHGCNGQHTRRATKLLAKEFITRAKRFQTQTLFRITKDTLLFHFGTPFY